MNKPEWIQTRLLDFHIPGWKGLVTLRTESRWDLYTQLVCWCLVQRFWYYVLHDPQASDHLYDEVESYVAKLETELGGVKNKHSPTQNVGSQNSWMYPRSILMLFSKHPTFQKVR